MIPLPWKSLYLEATGRMGHTRETLGVNLEADYEAVTGLKEMSG